MPISNETKETIINWLNQKCGVIRCFCCGHQKAWNLEGAAMTINLDLDSFRIHYADGIPQITICCPNCGYIMNFNPLVMGIKPTNIDEHNIS
ncbi:MAG: hypothetical protein WCW01_01120 [Gammaproteobacteria bacterium]